MVAFSLSFHCTRPKRLKSATEARSNPMIPPEFQRQLVPPFCSTSSSEHTAPRRMITPKGSMARNFVWKPCFWQGLSMSLSLMHSRTRSKIAAPIGRFLALNQNQSLPDLLDYQGVYIQKHHLQPIRSDKTPPSIGPPQALMPNTLTTAPMYS